MQLTFTSLSSEEKNITLSYPVDFAGQVNDEGRRTELIENWGSFKLTDTWFEGVCICATNVRIKAPCNLQLRCDNFCWIMNFVLDGELNARFAGVKYPSIKSGKYHTFCAPRLNAGLGFDRSTRLFTICLTRNFISKLMGKDMPADVYDITKAFTMINKGDYLHTRMHTVITDMMTATQTGYVRRIFMESKILELLSMQLHQADNAPEPPKGFNRDDIARLHEAKTYIAQNLQTPYSLIELARKTGLNDFKLKKGFKALFGHTVFGYLFELRMGTAYSLLQNNKTVSEVAETIGYKNPHHFTAAFKKRFGFLPSQVNKMQL